MCSHAIDLPSSEPRATSEKTGALSLSALPASAESAAHRKAPCRNSRRKLWDTPEQYHCPIIGTCLHVEELRTVARKAKSALDPRASDYEVHVRFVASAGEKNSLSIAAQRLLEKKHAGAVRRFARAKDEEGLRALWRAAIAAGQVPGAFWALMTHLKADAGLKRLAYQDVHMLSHQVGAGLVTDARLLAETRAELVRVRKDACDETRRARTALNQRDARIAALEERLAASQGLERELAEARRTIAELRSDRLQIELQEQLERLRTQVEDLRRSEDRATNQAALWRQRFEESSKSLGQRIAELEELRAANRLLERLFGDASDPHTGCASCGSEPCGAPDLAGRRVLCIGGRSSLACHYRSLVERCKGEFVHHDGGLEDNRQRLESLLSAADLVVCPADCVSHDAYLKAKRYCKRMAKPCVLLASSGVASFARALEQVAS